MPLPHLPCGTNAGALPVTAVRFLFWRWFPSSFPAPMFLAYPMRLAVFSALPLSCVTCPSIYCRLMACSVDETAVCASQLVVSFIFARSFYFAVFQAWVCFLLPLTSRRLFLWTDLCVYRWCSVRGVPAGSRWCFSMDGWLLGLLGSHRLRA